MALTEKQQAQRNLNPHAEAILAMNWWSDDYAFKQRGGSMDFWDSLPVWKKKLCRDLVKRIRAAETAEWSEPACEGHPDRGGEVMAGEGNPTTTIKPWNEGFGARLRGKTIHENPFPPFTKSNSDWQAGWEDQDEHLRDRDEALNSIGWFG